MLSVSASREIRVFLSSTFRDMEAERHYLVTRVFPEIRQLCYQRRVNFSEIDLRWGITEEAAHNGQTVQICLEEIERCRALGIPPFFIGFLGERYGWVPQHEDLAAYWAQASDQRYAELIRTALAENISVTELEIRFAFLAPPAEFTAQLPVTNAPRVQMYFRAPALTEAMASRDHAQDIWFDRLPGGKPDTVGVSKLADLKQRLRQHSPRTVAIDGYAHVEEFGNAVKTWLLSTIDALYPAESIPSVWQRRTHEHAQYAAVRRQTYVPLPTFHQDIVDVLQNSQPHPLLIVAPSGMGKSAFLASLAQDGFPGTSTRVMSHFVGADGDTSLENWRNRLFYFLAPEQITSLTAPSNTDPWGTLLALLHQNVQGHQTPLVLILDAINQLDNNDASVDLLRTLRLPAQVKLVMSTTPDLLNRPELSQSREPWLIKMLPALTSIERKALCEASLAQVSKALSPDLTRRLIDAPASTSPLFLRLVLEELCLHAHHEELFTRLEWLLQHRDAGTLFLSTLSASDKDFPAQALASRAACLIAVSWRGLTHSELAHLLTEQHDDPFARLPDSELIPLLARLAPYCQNSEGRLQLLHPLLRTALLQSQHMHACRQAIIRTFTGDTPFALAERIWQWKELGDDTAVIHALSDVMNVIRLYETEPALLRQVWTLTGVYEEASLQEGLRQPFTWHPAHAGTLNAHIDSAQAIFTWLRQTKALPTAVAWGDAIRPAIDLDSTAPGRKANFYNTLALAHHKLNDFEPAEVFIRRALVYGKQLDKRYFSRMLVTLAGILDKTQREEEALQQYQQAIALAETSPRDEETLAAIHNLLGMRSAHTLEQNDESGLDEAGEKLRIAIINMEKQPASVQKQIALSDFYANYAAVLAARGQFIEASAWTEKAIAASQDIYGARSKERAELNEMRDLFARLARQYGQHG